VFEIGVVGSIASSNLRVRVGPRGDESGLGVRRRLEDGEIKSEQSSTCSAAMAPAMGILAAEAATRSLRGGVEVLLLRSSGEAREGESSISMVDEAVSTTGAGSEAVSETKEKAVIQIETNQKGGGRQGSWRR
jgi:hypothetical protein